MMLKILLLSALVGSAVGATCTLPSSLGNGIVGNADGTNGACVASAVLADNALCDVKLDAGYVDTNTGSAVYECDNGAMDGSTGDSKVATLEVTGCAANYYQSDGTTNADVVCTACAAGSLIVTGNTANSKATTSCSVCSTLSSGNCKTGCPANTYQSAGVDDSDIVCTVCDAGEIKTAEAVAGATTSCTACTATQLTTAGVCKTGCPAQYYQDVGTDDTDNTCAACAAGKWKAAAAAGATNVCADCDSLSNTACGSTLTCTSASNSHIVAATTGYDAGNKCKSNAFFTAGGNSGDDSCQTCTVDTPLLANSLASCTACTALTADACTAGTCAATFHTFTSRISSGDNAGCSACGATSRTCAANSGTYKDTTACDGTNDAACTACTLISNAASGATYTCTTSGDSVIDTPSATTDKCADGYDYSAGPPGTCTKCTALCTHCAEDMFQTGGKVAAGLTNAGTATCDDCTGTKTIAAAAVGTAATTCSAGVCAANEYTSSSTCVACPSGKTRAAGDTTAAADTYSCGAQCATTTSAAGTVEASIALVALAVAATLV